MKNIVCRTVLTHDGEEFVLTENEEKFIRALERLSKQNAGRLNLIANGTISIRINGYWHKHNIDAFHQVNILCEGGDGGD